MPSLAPLSPPHWTQSVKFRLALTYAITVYAVGSLLVGGMYAWQSEQLDESVIVGRRVVLENTETGARLDITGLMADDLSREALLAMERNAYLRALDNLRKATIIGLMVLVLVAFAIGWVLAHITLRPVNRMAAVARDISGSDLSRRIGLHGPNDEFKGLADTIDSMLDRLQAAFEDQRRFVQDASHELRNPLAVARTNLELALSDPDADAAELRASAEVAQRSTERMAVLVDDLLNQARTGVPAVQLRRVDLAAVAGTVAEEYRTMARAASVSIVLDSPEPVVILGDPTAMTRAVANLVSNAIRYAPSGTVVSLSVGRVGHEAVVSVVDHGPGLSPEEQAKVFTRFWRADQSSPGVGLGLSIVQQIARRHGGVAEVHSVPGGGATFSLRLPLVTDGAGVGTTPPGPDPRPNKDANRVRDTHTAMKTESHTDTHTHTGDHADLHAGDEGAPVDTVEMQKRSRS
jgi:signal transduction histidine kinase